MRMLITDNKSRDEFIRRIQQVDVDKKKFIKHSLAGSMRSTGKENKKLLTRIIKRSILVANETGIP